MNDKVKSLFIKGAMSNIGTSIKYAAMSTRIIDGYLSELIAGCDNILGVDNIDSEVANGIVVLRFSDVYMLRQHLETVLQLSVGAYRSIDGCINATENGD